MQWIELTLKGKGNIKLAIPKTSVISYKEDGGVTIIFIRDVQLYAEHWDEAVSAYAFPSTELLFIQEDYSAIKFLLGVGNE